MKYFIIDNFIDEKFCNRLIEASDTQNDNKDKTNMHGGRQFLSSTTLQFHELLNNSNEWKNLENKLNSQQGGS